MMRTRRLLTLVPAAVLLACGEGAVDPAGIAEPAFATATGCGMHRPYGLLVVSHEQASAGVVGHVAPRRMTDTGHWEFTLTVTSKMAKYFDESVAGGCTPSIAFETASMTGALGKGEASLDGTVEVFVDGASLGSFHDSQQQPPYPPTCNPQWHQITCRTDRSYEVPVSVPIATGSVISLSASATVFADAVGTSTWDQAHASWKPRAARLLIPIP